MSRSTAVKVALKTRPQQIRFKFSAINADKYDVNKWLRHVYYFALGSILLLSTSAFAINGRTTYQAKIYKPDGYPLESVSVNFRFTVLDPSSSCVLYIEDYAAVNMIGSGGFTSFSLGMGTRTYPASGPVTFASVFDNSIPSFVCQAPGVYNPISTDNRKIVMQFNEGNGWQTLPAMAINSVPYAMYSAKAQNSQSLNGKADTSFVEYSTLATLNCQANEAIKFNGANFSCIAVGVSSSGISSVTTSGTVLTTAGTASAPVISINVASMSSDGYLTSVDYAEFKSKLSASSTQIINTLGYAPVSGTAVNSQIQASQLSGDVSGTVSANVVQSVGGKTAAQLSTSVDETLAATTSATVDTIVKRNSSGNITVNDIYANAAKVNYVDIYKPSTSFNIRLQAPTSLAANYTLNLPTTSGTSGQVLSTDGSGSLSWISPSTGSVTSVSATAPLSSTGGATPTLSISQATSATNGYLSASDWNTFNNKQQATSAAIIATLGYTPANATSATQWTTNGTDIFYSGGDVGIGVSNPVHALDVLGTVRAGAANNGSVSMGNDGNAFIELREYDNAGSPYIDFANDSSTDFDARFILSGDDTLEMNGAMFGLGLRPTALLSLAAGTSATASLKFTSGTLLTSPQSGTMEYDGSNFYLTDGANQRRIIATGSSQGSIDNTSQINSTSNLTLNPAGSVVVSSPMSVQGNLTANGNLTTSGSLGVGTATPGEKLDVLGNMRIGNSDSNYIAFRGTTGDGAGSYNHTYIGERVYAPTESSELLLFKGNDSDNTSGPDRIRMAAGNIVFDTYASPDAPSGTFEAVASSPLISTKMIIKGDGKVGIGTTSPATDLEIKGSVAALTLTRSVSSPSSPDIYLQKDRGASTPVINGDTIGHIGFRGLSSDGSYIRGARISSYVTSAPGVSQLGADVRIYTNDSAADATERLRITQNGNVGIGNSTPTAPLHVATGGVAGWNSVMKLETTNANAHPLLMFRHGGSDTGYVGFGDGGSTNGFGVYNYLNADLTLGTSSTTMMTFKPSGNIGIGTTSPVTKLDVRGPNGSPSSYTSGTIAINGGGVAALLLGTDDTAASAEYAWIQSHGTRPLYINKVGNNTILNANSGSVGIGTSNPTTRLEVAGGDVNVPTGRMMFNASTQSGTAGIASTDAGSIFGEHDVNSEVSRLVIEIFDNVNDQIVLRTNAQSGGSNVDMVKVQYDQVALAPTTGNVGIGVTTPTSKLQVNGGIKQPNYGQLVLTFDGTTRTVSMPAFLTSTYIDAHQDETYTWRGIAPRLKDTVGCAAGPHASYLFDGYDTTWNGTYRMTLGKLNATGYIAEIEWRGWGTNLRDAANALVGTASNQGTVQATLYWNGSVWSLEHMQGQVGATPFSCH
ncbi:MAG: hypothetical protein NDI63_04830 [Pseudobdellovibrio sp.]|nr:hypothetical protein [Pseudobdellovibrio sp.]